MRSVLILCCVAVQLSVLAYMVYGRESVVASGQRIYMATAPIDPRDPFRGDFVRLQYPANNISSAPQQWSDVDNKPGRGEVVYALLEEKPSGLHEVVLFTDTLPEDGLFIRGRRSSGRAWQRGGWRTSVRFGIEQLFVQQGSGIAIEEKRGIRGGLQTAMEVEVAIDKKGTAVLTDFRWNDLGIQIDLSENFGNRTTDATQGDQTAPVAEGPHVIVSIQNVSTEPVTLNNPGDNCGFRLEPAAYNSKYSEAFNSCTELNEMKPLTLAPEQTYQVEINLTDPRWFVEFKNNGNISTGDLREFQSNEMMRVVYRGDRMAQYSRSSAESAVDSEAPRLWRGDLLSQGFNSRGRID